MSILDFLYNYKPSNQFMNVSTQPSLPYGANIQTPFGGIADGSMQGYGKINPPPNVINTMRVYNPNQFGAYRGLEYDPNRFMSFQGAARSGQITPVQDI